VESITAYVACGAAFVLSYYFGFGRAYSTPFAAILGAMSGVGFAMAFFSATVTVAVLLPGTFDGRTLGIYFVRLLVLAPIGAAAIAALAHRYALARMRF